MENVNPVRRRLAASLPLLVTALYLRPALAEASVYQASRTLMGTRLDITVQGLRRDELVGAVDAAFERMAERSEQMSRFEPTSMVSALHMMSGVRPLRVSPEMMAVLHAGQDLARQCEGGFDLTVGAYAGWSFEPGHCKAPDAAELAQESRLVGYADLQLDERAGTAYLRRRGMRIDLGGIAKLPILEAGLQVLRERGIRHAMLNGGGDVRVIGGLMGRPWRIGLRDPRAPARLLGTVDLDDGWIAASGDYERCFDLAGQHYHHILDPRSGHPTTELHGVTLVARDLHEINGVGAALMVKGAAWSKAWLADHPQVGALLVDRDRSVWTNPRLDRVMRA